MTFYYKTVLKIGKLVLISSLIIFLISFVSTPLFTQEIETPLQLLQQGQFSEAISAANARLQRAPKDISAHAVKGWGYLNLRQWQNALNVGLQALQWGENDARIIEIVGEAYHGLQRYDEAEEYFEKYLSLRPNGSMKHWVYYYLSDIYKKRNAKTLAEFSMTVAVVSDSSRLEWWLLLGVMREDMGLKEKAREAYRTVLQLDPQNAQGIQGLARVQG